MVHAYYKDFLAGGTASAIADTITAPVERVKLLLQLQNSSQQILKSEQYKGIIDVLQRLPKEQGILSFWRGNSLNVLRGFPIQAFNLSFKDYLHVYFLEGVNRKTDFWRFTAGNLAAGGIAGVLSLSLIYPLDFARTRITVDVGGKRCKKTGRQKPRQFLGILDCWRKTYQVHGIPGLYKGYTLSVLGIGVYRALYYGIYDTLKGSLLDKPEESRWYVRWIMAQSAVATAGLIVYPFDTVRRRMMMQAGRPKEKIWFRNSRECFKKIFLLEGIRSFYRGAGANILRSTGGAMVLVLYDEIKNLIVDWWQMEHFLGMVAYWENIDSRWAEKCRAHLTAAVQPSFVHATLRLI